MLKNAKNATSKLSLQLHGLIILSLLEAKMKHFAITGHTETIFKFRFHKGLRFLMQNEFLIVLRQTNIKAR